MISETLKRYWGYESLLPLQSEVIEAILAERDTVTVLPTGGGKSLCYQLPAVCVPGTAIVVSPLIALMKDQVDTLVALGIPAAAVNRSQGAVERRRAADQVRAGHLKLLYMSPERLLTDKTLEFLAAQRISLIAIDEAHCISSWGHDFRPEYRELRRLRDVFPGVALHALTATATPHVRQDIIAELALRDPRVIVGDFRRANLIYKVLRREGGVNQICAVLDRYRNQSGIVYCISRAEVERTSQLLNELGYRTLPYHAGLSDEQRRAHQEAFVHDQCEAIVATIAFGMGIDKSNVRYVIHAGMPRSIENYQQESGRAGRDGLEAECWLLHSPRDLKTWQYAIGEGDPEAAESARQSLERIYQFCIAVDCRHRRLCAHFGQELESNCGACDICLGDLQRVADPLTLAQKILSCVLRVQERFGTVYVAHVLKGSKNKQIRQFGHQSLSTWGLLREFSHAQIRDWIEQLLGQDVLLSDGEYHLLKLTPLGHRVLRGEWTPTLLAQSARPAAGGLRENTPTALLNSWEGVDHDLFDALRALRRQCAMAEGMPAYIVFSDSTLRDMARRRPSTAAGFLNVHGVGSKKAEVYGTQFIECITSHCHAHNQDMDIDPGQAKWNQFELDRMHQSVEQTPHWPHARELGKTSAAAVASGAFELFARGMGVEQVAEQIGRSSATVGDYLYQYVCSLEATDPSPWVAELEIQRVEIAAEYALLENPASPFRLKPIHTALHSAVGYTEIRLVLACRANRLAQAAGSEGQRGL